MKESRNAGEKGTGSLPLKLVHVRLPARDAADCER